MSTSLSVTPSSGTLPSTVMALLNINPTLPAYEHAMEVAAKVRQLNPTDIESSNGFDSILPEFFLERAYRVNCNNMQTRDEVLRAVRALDEARCSLSEMGYCKANDFSYLVMLASQGKDQEFRKVYNSLNVFEKAELLTAFEFRYGKSRNSQTESAFLDTTNYKQERLDALAIVSMKHHDDQLFVEGMNLKIKHEWTSTSQIVNNCFFSKMQSTKISDEEAQRVIEESTDLPTQPGESEVIPSMETGAPSISSSSRRTTSTGSQTSLHPSSTLTGKQESLKTLKAEAIEFLTTIEKLKAESAAAQTEAERYQERATELTKLVLENTTLEIAQKAAAEEEARLVKVSRKKQTELEDAENALKQANEAYDKKANETQPSRTDKSNFDAFQKALADLLAKANEAESLAERLQQEVNEQLPSQIKKAQQDAINFGKNLQANASLYPDGVYMEAEKATDKAKEQGTLASQAYNKYREALKHSTALQEAIQKSEQEIADLQLQLTPKPLKQPFILSSLSPSSSSLHDTVVSSFSSPSTSLASSSLHDTVVSSFSSLSTSLASSSLHDTVVSSFSSLSTSSTSSNSTTSTETDIFGTRQANTAQRTQRTQVSEVTTSVSTSEKNLGEAIKILAEISKYITSEGFKKSAATEQASLFKEQLLRLSDFPGLANNVMKSYKGDMNNFKRGLALNAVAAVLNQVRKQVSA